MKEDIVELRPLSVQLEDLLTSPSSSVSAPSTSTFERSSPIHEDDTGSSNHGIGEAGRSSPINGKAERSSPINGEAGRSSPINGEAAGSSPINGEAAGSSPNHEEQQAAGSSPLKDLSEDSCHSFPSSETSNSNVDADMKKEEEAARRENEEEEERMKKEMIEKVEKEVKEQRYKRLMHLLSKSKVYSDFILKTIDTQTETEKKKISKKKTKSPKGSSVENKENNKQEEERKGSTTRLKRKASQNISPPSKRIKRHTDYQISDVIDKESVAAASATNCDSADEGDEGFPAPKLLTGVTLRPYQLAGFNWLRVLYENAVNGLLADEMGLGKTVQSISLLCHLIEQGVPGPYLVVAPLSTLHNWCNEIRNFCPQVPYILFHGPEKERRSKLLLANKYHDVTLYDDKGKKVKKVRTKPVVITSYDMVIKSKYDLKQFVWKYLVVDEGHRIKNYNCILVRTLKELTTSNRLLLTGTPLQNDLSELWSLLNFLLPEVFNNLDTFESWFDVTTMNDADASEKILKQETESKVISTLHQILSPFLLRRVKSDVALHLPPKRELLVYAPLTPIQLKLYTATITRDFADFKLKEEHVEYNENGRPKRKCSGVESQSRLQALMNEDDSPETLDTFLAAAVIQEKKVNDGKRSVRKTEMNVKLQNTMMQCRRVANHPYLVAYPLDDEGEYKIDDNLITSAGKMLVLDQLLTALHARGHKVLLFSQMTKVLDIIHDFLTLRPQYNYRRLDGSVRLEQRQEDIDSFNKDPDVFLFLLSTRAANLGINLTAADTVIIFDSDWNPQQDLQAQDRCHRIGQVKPVLILRLVTAATIDERIVERAANKRCLEKLIIKEGTFNNSRLDKRNLQVNMNKDELLELLKQKDHHHVYKSEISDDGEVYSSEELNKILDRSGMVREENDENSSEDSTLKENALFKLVK